MSKKHDKLESVKLTPENTSSVTKTEKNFKIKPSRAKLVNAALALGLPLVKP